MGDFIEERLDDDIPTKIDGAPETGTAQQTQQAQQAQPQPNYNSAPAVSLNDYVSYYDSPSGISEAGKKFLEGLRGDLQDPVKAAHGLDIKVIELVQPVDTIAVINKKAAVILLFAESNMNPDYPVAHCSKLAAANLGSIEPGCSVLETIVLVPDDYNRYHNFASHIRNAFIAVNNPNRLTIENIRASNLSFSDNPNDYYAARDRLSPHAIPLRADVMITVYSQSHQQKGAYVQQNMYGPENEDYWARSGAAGGRVPIATIGINYKPFRTQEFGLGKIAINLEINELATCIPDIRMLALLIPIAVEKCLVSGSWVEYYRNNPINAHGDHINIGQLFPDGNGGRGNVVNKETFDQLIHTQFLTPNVLLNIPEGRARIPGMWKFVSNRQDVYQDVVNDFCLFYGGQYPYTDQVTPYALEEGNTTYRGFYLFGNKMLDTDNIDYFGEYPRHPEDAVKCDTLLLKKANPLLTVQDQRQFEPNLSLIYSVDSVSIRPQFYKWLRSQLPMLNILYNNNNNGIVSMANSVNASQAWDQYIRQPAFTNNTGSVFNRFDPVYGNTWGN